MKKSPPHLEIICRFFLAGSAELRVRGMELVGGLLQLNRRSCCLAAPCCTLLITIVYTYTMREANGEILETSQRPQQEPSLTI